MNEADHYLEMLAGVFGASARVVHQAIALEDTPANMLSLAQDLERVSLHNPFIPIEQIIERIDAMIGVIEASFAAIAPSMQVPLADLSGRVDQLRSLTETERRAGNAVIKAMSAVQTFLNEVDGLHLSESERSKLATISPLTDKTIPLDMSLTYMVEAITQIFGDRLEIIHLSVPELNSAIDEYRTTMAELYPDQVPSTASIH